ncbi:MAG: tol-pal system-associated acyl-CoA thioesterase [Gammaproteobacteria bacterium]|nr:tol-pal system-associated acyl-CoA thioesterase [Gammaproteobacteria bacterium]
MTQQYSIPVRVYYEDTDAGGVVYYANYLRFMERCRSDWLRDIGFDIDDVTKRFGIIFAVRSASIEYHKPARLSDLLEVSVNTLQPSRVSLSVTQHIHRDQELLCSGRIKLASLNVGSFDPQPIPPELLNRMNEWKTP